MNDLPAVGAVIGDYVLEQELGGGGFGSVWRARSRRDDSTVALKVLVGKYASGDGARLRAEVELLAASASSTSPHVVKVLGGGVDPSPYVVMEYVEGTDLARRLQEQGTLSINATVEVATAVGDALAALADAGIIHRDVKPANILIHNTGLIKLADFGIAKIIGFDTITATSQLPMSMAYAAHEVWEGAPTHKSDIYALGALLYQCLVGVPPFVGTYAQVYRQHLTAPPDLALLPVETPQSLRQLIGSCLAKDPSQRPDARAMLASLRDAQPTSVVVQETTSAVIADRRVNARPHVIGFVLAAVSLLCAGTVAFLAMRSDRSESPPPVDETKLPNALVLRAGAAIDQFSYLRMDGKAVDHLAVRSHQLSDPTSSCERVIRHDYIDVFARKAEDWVQVFDSSKDVLKYDSPSSCFAQFDASAGELHVLRLKGDSHEQLGFPVTYVAMAPLAPEVVVISHESADYAVKQFGIGGSGYEGTVDWPTPEDARSIRLSSRPFLRGVEILLTHCRVCSSETDASETIGYDAAHGDVRVLTSTVATQCQEGLVSAVNLDMQAFEIGCETFVVDDRTQFVGRSTLEELRIGDSVKVVGGNAGDLSLGATPHAERVEVTPHQSTSTSKPQDPTDFEIDDLNLKFRWDPAQLNSEYHLERTEGSQDAWHDVLVVSAELHELSLITNLQQKHGLQGLYKYRVYATNAVGRSSPSNELLLDVSSGFVHTPSLGDLRTEPTPAPASVPNVASVEIISISPPVGTVTRSQEPVHVTVRYSSAFLATMYVDGSFSNYGACVGPIPETQMPLIANTSDVSVLDVPIPCQGTVRLDKVSVSTFVCSELPAATVVTPTADYCRGGAPAVEARVGTSPSPNSRFFGYVVQDGDTLTSIAQSHLPFGEDAESFAKAIALINRMTFENATLNVGQQIKVPQLLDDQSSEAPRLYSIYTVAEGDTVPSIASRFGIDPAYVLANNRDIQASLLVLGQSVVIPPANGILHEVRSGETLADIAAKYDVSVDRIIGFPGNGLDSDPFVLDAQLVFVPDARIPAGTQ